MSILDFPTAWTLGENDFFYVVQNGVDRKATFKHLPFATADTHGLMSYFDKRKLSREAVAYNFDNGLLVKTSLLSSANEMFIVEFTVNSYSGNPPQRTIIQGYNYNVENRIMQTSGAVICGNPVVVKCFIHNGYLCFWTKQSFSFQTFIVNLSTSESPVYIMSVENATMPTGVGRLVEINPVNSRSYSQQLPNIQSFTPPPPQIPCQPTRNQTVVPKNLRIQRYWIIQNIPLTLTG